MGKHLVGSIGNYEQTERLGVVRQSCSSHRLRENDNGIDQSRGGCVGEVWLLVRIVSHVADTNRPHYALHMSM